MRGNFSYLLISSTLFLFHCRDLNHFPDNPIPYTGTKILAHKAGGEKPYSPWQDNTLEAAVYGYSNLDGIEIDVQKSRSNTLWLFHDGFLPECNGESKRRITGKTDLEIEQYIQCRGGGFKISKLEEIFQYHRQQNLDKKISLDVKSWLPTLYSNTPKYHKDLALEIVQLVHRYQMEGYVMVECENAYLLNLIRKNSRIECYLTTFGDFEEGARKALKFKYAGISFSYDANNPISKEDIQRIRNKGLKIQLWTINSKDEIIKAMLLEPDYIQTDNVLLQ